LLSLETSAAVILIKPEPIYEYAEIWQQIKVGLWIIVAFLVVINCVVLLLFSYMIKPINKIIEGFEKLEIGNYKSRIKKSNILELDIIGKKFNSMIDNLRQSNNKIHQLSQNLIDVQEQEKSELARDLHDELGQSLTALQAEAASISKSDLVSDLVGEYPELQGVIGKYFAVEQGFSKEIANAIQDHYLPLGPSGKVPKEKISIAVAVADKIDTLIGFFGIDEKPTSSKDPFALRRAAIGLLRIIIENKLSFKLRDLISYAIRLYQEQGVEIKNEKTEQEVLDFIKERIRNVLKLKNIKPDIIEASVSSHAGDNFLALYAKTILMNKYKNKGIGLNAISSYKRASNILDKAGKGITGRPDAVLFRKEEEKILHEKINEIRKAFTVKDDNKDYENLLIRLSETKESTDNFFDNVVVNDENQDIKNNRLELLKLFCNTFDNFIDFSKLEGL